MRARVLPREEWHRLKDTEAWPMTQRPDTDAHVIVVENGAEIVGCHVLLSVLHAECLWVHPDHRGKGSVIRRLWPAVQQTAREAFEAGGFVTFATDDRVKELLEHVGATPMPGACYMVPLTTEKDVCPQP